MRVMRWETQVNTVGAQGTWDEGDEVGNTGQYGEGIGYMG